MGICLIVHEGLWYICRIHFTVIYHSHNYDIGSMYYRVLRSMFIVYWILEFKFREIKKNVPKSKKLGASSNRNGSTPRHMIEKAIFCVRNTLKLQIQSCVLL